MSTVLPAPKEVRDLLVGVVGRDVDFTVDASALTPDSPGGVIVGEYVNDAMGSLALIALDLPLAAYLGAALALVPPGGAEASIEDGFLSDSLLDNAYEVLNIAASLFNKEGRPHLRIGPLYDTARAMLPQEIDSWLIGFVPRLDAVVNVAGYGQGRIGVLIR